VTAEQFMIASLTLKRSAYQQRLNFYVFLTSEKCFSYFLLSTFTVSKPHTMLNPGGHAATTFSFFLNGLYLALYLYPGQRLAWK